MGELFAVVSGKGGTGKTSLCAALATALAKEGKRVLCIDCDVGLRNLDISLGLSECGALSFWDVSEGGYSLEDAFRHPVYPTLAFLTAPMNCPVEKINAAAGVNGTTGADGGFLLQEDFAGRVMDSAVQSSPLLNRLDRYTCSNAANAMRWVSVDETDVSASVFGGVQMYWASEATAVAASKPAFREMKLDLEKMMGVCYCTDEMLQDATFLTGFMGTAFSLAGDRLLTEAVINGDGTGKPTGLLHSSALVTVDKESGQAAGTLLGANVLKMVARTMPRNRDRLVWLKEQLPTLAVQSGQAAKFLWNPEGGLGNFDTQRVMNKPVLLEDCCSAQGSKGDVMLVDPFQYILLTKGTAKQDWSIHVEFLTDQNCFRMVFRCNGAPKVNKPLTIKNSTKTRSPFVTLAARS